MIRALAVLALAAVFLTGCDSPKKTVETLRSEITEFKASADPKVQARIDENFIKLENQIAQVETKDTDEAQLLKRQYASLQGDYQAAKLAKTLNDAKNAIQGFGDALKEGAKSFGDALKNSGTGSSE